MNYLLHIDTSADIATVAISGDGMILAQTTNTDNRNYAASLNYMIDEVLGKSGIELKNLQCVVVCAGPGSYTGLRIGMSTAKGLCYVLDKPLILHDKLTLLAKQQYDKNKECSFYLSILKAREGEYFICLYNSDFECIKPPTLVLEDELKNVLSANDNVLCIGDIPEWTNQITDKQQIFIAQNTIDTDSWAAYAYETYQKQTFADLHYAEPFYLKQVYTHK